MVDQCKCKRRLFRSLPNTGRANGATASVQRGASTPRAAHKCSDAIYSKLTGEKPFFDSRIAYIAESGPKGKRVKRLAIMDSDGANHKFITSGQSTRNHNVPGDGKFDQSDYPSPLELQVGRVDLSLMESFQYYLGQNEQTLLSNYLTKLHNFKIKQTTPIFRGAVFDNFEDLNIAGCGYRSVSANTSRNRLQKRNMGIS